MWRCWFCQYRLYSPCPTYVLYAATVDWLSTMPLPDRWNNQIDHSLASLPVPTIKIDKEAHKWRKDMLTRDEIIQAMHAIGCGVNTTTKKKMKKQQQQLLVGEHGVRICKRDFAACLASMGGKFKRRRGVRFWVNIGMTRKPLFSWDKNE